MIYGALAMTLVLGSAFLLVGWAMARAEVRRRRTGLVTPGRIVGQGTLKVSSPGEPRSAYNVAVVDFFDRSGRLRRFENPVGTNLPVSVGRVVQVWFDPDDPEASPMIHDHPGNWILPAALLTAGTLSTLVGLVLLARVAGLLD